MDGVIAWLTGLPLAVLYPLMGIFAAIENVFPPIPADTIVALGSWLAARGEGSAIGAFLVVWLGNVAGAAGMYFVGRRKGAVWIRRRFPKLANERSEERLRSLHGRYGILALVISRFIPGVRALVPPFAGALGISAVSAIGAMAAASAVWYGFISYLAFTAGAEWDELSKLVQRSSTIVAIVAAALAVLAVAAWLIWRRRSRS